MKIRKIFSFNWKFFLLGIFIGFIPVTVYANTADQIIPLETTIQTQPEVSPTFTPTPTPTPSPTPTPTPSPTPSPTPTPAPPPAAPSEIESIIERISNEYGVDSNLMKKIAYCESKYNSSAINGPYAGLFQFAQTSWKSNREQMDHDPNPNLRLSAEESAKTAAYAISRGKHYLWPNCK